MPLLIDTSNVLHVTGVLPPILAGVDVLGLADLIEVSRYRAETVWLVCDGAAGPNRPTLRGRIVTHYVGHTGDADTQIGRMIEASSGPRRLLVISSDHQVRKMAQRRRCRWLSSEDFLAQLGHDGLHAINRNVGPPGATPRRRAATRGEASPPRPMSPRAALPLKGREVSSWVRRFGLDASWLSIESSGSGNAASDSASDFTRGPELNALAEGDGLRSIDGAAPSKALSTKTSTNRDQPSGEQSKPQPRQGRALEGVRTLAEIDPAELERFDMSEWLPATDAAALASPPAARPGGAGGGAGGAAGGGANRGRRGRSTKRRKRKP